MKTKAKALVMCLFVHFLQQCPDLFEDTMTQESRKLLRREVFLPWKFQRTIDPEGTGGLNCECLNGIGTGVEGPHKHTVGLTPEGSTVAATARKLESHASADHGLDTHETRNEHGPSFRFDMDPLLRLTLTGHGLDASMH